MIPVIGKFEETFADDAGLYVVIGGAARELIYAKAAAGDRVRKGEIGKHRRDIFRLVSILPGGITVDLPKAVQDEIEAFLDTVTLPSPDYMKSLGLGRITFDEMKEAIRAAYLPS